MKMISLARFESLATVTLALCSLSTPPLSHYQRLACGIGVTLVTATWICDVLVDSVHMPPSSGLQDRTVPPSSYRSVPYRGALLASLDRPLALYMDVWCTLG